MSLFNYIAKLDQKFSWSFWGFVLALLFGGVTIYTVFVKKNSPDLSFQILSTTNVLDLHESIGDLDIIYKGTSLNKNNQSLRIVVLRVLSNGDQAILPSYYDPDDPIGFRVIHGQIVENPKILEARTTYLREHLKISQRSPEQVVFSKPILEPGDFFLVKVLLLYNKNEEPRVVPIGKVAGVKRIAIARLDKIDQHNPRWTAIFSGSYWIQIARLIAYPIILLLSGIPIVFVAAFLTDRISIKRRKDAVQSFKLYAAPRLKEADEFFFDTFINNDYAAVRNIFNFLNDESRMARAKRLDMRHRRSKVIDALINHDASPDSRYGDYRDRRDKRDKSLFLELVDLRIIGPSESGFKVDTGRKEILADFIGFLQRKNFNAAELPYVTRPDNIQMPP